MLSSLVFFAYWISPSAHIELCNYRWHMKCQVSRAADEARICRCQTLNLLRRSAPRLHASQAVRKFADCRAVWVPQGWRHHYVAAFVAHGVDHSLWKGRQRYTGVAESASTCNHNAGVPQQVQRVFTPAGNEKRDVFDLLLQEFDARVFIIIRDDDKMTCLRVLERCIVEAAGWLEIVRMTTVDSEGVAAANVRHCCIGEVRENLSLVMHQYLVNFIHHSGRQRQVWREGVFRHMCLVAPGPI